MPASSSSPRRSPPPPLAPPSSSSPQPPAANEDDRDDTAIEDDGDDESTPFLPSSSQPQPSNNNSPPSPPPSSFQRTIRILTGLALTFSILTLASLFATAVASQAGPGSFNLPWPTKEGINGVLAPAIFSLLFSAYNLRRFRSNKSATPLNLIVDFVIAFFAITYGAGGLSALLDGRGGWCSYAGGDDYSLCRRGALPVMVFAGMAMGAGTLCGVMHLVLFCIRCRVAYSSGVGRFPWTLPVGQLKFEVSIKFLKEPEREEREGTV